MLVVEVALDGRPRHLAETTLERGSNVTPEAWMLSTRIVQRRALRVGTNGEAPIRKFAPGFRTEA